MFGWEMIEAHIKIFAVEINQNVPMALNRWCVNKCVHVIKTNLQDWLSYLAASGIQFKCSII